MVVPPDVTVSLDTRVGLGNVKVPGSDEVSGNSSRGFQLHPVNGQASKGTLVLSLRVGLGDIKVVQS